MDTVHDQPSGNPLRSSERGSSLIEVMIAMTVSVIILGGLMSAVLRHGKLRQTHVERNAAISAALDTIEELRKVDIVDLPTLDGSGFDVLDANGNPGGLQPQATDADGLPGELRVVVDQTGAGKTVYRVTATVRWTGVNGNTRVAIDMLMGERK